MDKLESITIENMLENIFTTVSIKKKKKDIVNHYLNKFNVTLFGGNGENGEQTVSEAEVSKRIDEVLKADKCSADPYLKYLKGFYSKEKKKSKPINPIDPVVDSNYIGKGGECIVMGELLFNGYNVNNMMVDEGIDLVASKNNVFYYIQVKTKNVSLQNKFLFQIRQDRFDGFLGTQIRYILVARCSFNGEAKNIFFTFSNSDIQRFLFNHAVPQPSQPTGNLSIKIEYDERTGKAYVYDNKVRDDVTFNMNNFNL